MCEDEEYRQFSFHTQDAENELIEFRIILLRVIFLKISSANYESDALC